METVQSSLNDCKTKLDIKQLDKLTRSILLSTREIPDSKPLSKRLKKKVLQAIMHDKPAQLRDIVEAEVIGFSTHIGTEGSYWNMLHFCAKGNSYKCIDYILKTQYQELKEEYRKLVNSRTIEGYTPIIVAIIHESHKALEGLLSMGGVDLQITDSLKTSPQEIALNYKNDHAIKCLMNYENRCKNKLYLNKQALETRIDFPQTSCCRDLMSKLLCCLSLGLYTHEIEHEEINSGIISERSVKKVSVAAQEAECIDTVQIGGARELSGYDIEWRKLSDIYKNKVTLFGSYNPFDIIQANFTIKNQLIIFQCLSQQSWVLRQNIKNDKLTASLYNITLYPNRTPQQVRIDGSVPFLKERKQAMFLSDSAELWPMLLQKALAKIHGGYLALNSVQPLQVLESITGFPTFQMPLCEFKSPGTIVPFLQKLSAKNYLFLLKGKPNGQLCETAGSIDCFNILNFYQKNSENMILINCPFVSKKWKLKEKYEPLALKLIKGHYNTHKQMCVWVEEKEIMNLFESVIFSLTLPSYERSQLVIRASSLAFIRFRIDKKREESLVFELVDQDTGEALDVQSLQVFRNGGQAQVEVLKREEYLSKTAEIECKTGDYICFYQLHPQPQRSSKRIERAKKNYLFMCWSVDIIQPESIEQESGVLEWFACLRTHFSQITEKWVVQTLNGHSLVLLRQPKAQKVYLKLDTITQDKVLNGMYEYDNGGSRKVQLVSEHADIHYCIIKSEVDVESVVFDFK